MNVRDALNKLLVAMREDKIAESTTAITEKLHLLLLQFLNDAKTEIDGVHDWYAHRTNITVPVIAGTTTYPLLTAPRASRLVYEKTPDGRELSSYDVTAGTKSRLVEVSLEEIEANYALDNGALTQEIINEVALYNDGDTLVLKVWPTPSAARTLKLRVFVPQNEYQEDDIDDDILGPATAIWKAALVSAVEERGEEMSGATSSLSSLRRKADNALVDAVWSERTDEDNTAHAV